MLQYTPLSTFRARFPTIDPQIGGSAVATIDACVVHKNGTLDVAVTPTVTAPVVGLYSVVFTIPGTYISGDLVTVLVQATVNGAQEWLVLQEFHVQANTIDSALSVAGGGVNDVTITVTDNVAAPLQGARVTLVFNGITRYSAVTNINGIAIVSPNEGDGTYSVRIACSGYAFTTTTLAVVGDTSHTYAMTVNAVTPSDPTFVTGYTTCRDEFLDVQAGVSHSLRIIELPTGMLGSTIDTTVRVVESVAITGRVEFINLIPGATYGLSRVGSHERVFKAKSIDFELPAMA